jgi:uncharacterized protein (TIGR03083 family)
MSAGTRDDTWIDVESIPAIDREEAMALAEAEYRRMATAIRRLTGDDWSRPTDCDRWDVRAMVLHVIGAMEANASVREMLHQQVAGRRVGKEIGGSSLDGTNELQVRERDDLHGDALVERFEATIDRAVAGRRKMPALVRRIPITMPQPWTGKRTLGWLNDIVYTRDTWMHRVDLSRATGVPLELTPDHDGRIVADAVADLARLAAVPFELVLTGPAGGRYRARAGAAQAESERHELDAVELARTIAGRRDGRAGLLSTEVPF